MIHTTIMQSYPPAPPNPLFGMLTWGFVVLIAYGFARLSSEGEHRFKGCKKTLAIGVLGMVIVTLIQSLSYWNWSLHLEAVNPFPVVIASMMIASPFILVPLIDLSVQWYQLIDSQKVTSSPGLEF